MLESDWKIIWFTSSRLGARGKRVDGKLLWWSTGTVTLGFADAGGIQVGGWASQLWVCLAPGDEGEALGAFALLIASLLRSSPFLFLLSSAC